MSFISKIGLGSVQFGLAYGISNEVGKTSRYEVSEILRLAKEIGIQYVDTARAYGDSEVVLGKSNATQHFKIISKFMPSAIEGDVIKQFQESCVNLKTNNLYAYLAHRPLTLIENKEDWEKVQELKRIKRVQKIGFSLNTPSELRLLEEEGILPDIIQVPYNYFDNRFKNTIIDLKSKGCEIHTRSAFLQGLFFTDIHKLAPVFNNVKPYIKQLQDIYQKELPSILLKYVALNEFVDCVIIGVETRVQLEESLAYIDRKELPPSLEINIPEEVLLPSNWPKRQR